MVIMRMVLGALAVLAFFPGAAPARHQSVERDVTTPRFKAVAFDFLVLFNPDSVIEVADRVAPGRGRHLTTLWRTRQFEYTWLRTITDRYVDFETITADALVFAADAMNVPLTAADRRRLLDAYLRLGPWPDAADALRRLRSAGVRVIALANFSPAMLEANVRAAGLADLFDDLVSTDLERTYKPDPAAYQLGVDRLRLRKQDILFVAFGGWDAAGARAFGFPTYWVNRSGQPAEELGVRADRTSGDLAGVLDYVLGPH